MNPLTEKVSRLFHTYYEMLAPECGYSTRKASAVSWDEVPAANKQLMRATVDAVFIHLEREAHFGDGDKVEVVVSIPGCEGEVFAKKGEQGQLKFMDGTPEVAFSGKRAWTTVDMHMLALHFKPVR